MTREALCQKAIAAMEYAYVPYSHYRVGAALLCQDGTVFTGCNIENVAFGPTNCAERTAFFKAVSEGKRNFTAIAVCGGKEGILEEDFFSPCGVCRQVMREFCDDDFQIHLIAKDRVETFTLAQLLPQSFRPERLDI